MDNDAKFHTITGVSGFSGILLPKKLQMGYLHVDRIENVEW